LDFAAAEFAMIPAGFEESRAFLGGKMRQTFLVSLAALALAAAAPFGADAQNRSRIGGKPNINGIWQAMNSANWNLEGHAATQLKDFWRLGAIGAIPAGQSVVKEGKIPYLPEALARRDENRAGWPKTDPEAACYLPGLPRATYLPHPFQIIQGDQDILFVYSFANANRAVHMKENRKTIDEVPVDLWMGWSNGQWEGDTLVVEVIANDDRTWLDRAGNYHSNQMKVDEGDRALYAPRCQPDAVRSDHRGSGDVLGAVDDLDAPVPEYGAECRAARVQVRRILREPAVQRVFEGAAAVGFGLGRLEASDWS
jgi:hypothetical protein